MAETTRTFIGLPVPVVFRQKLERLCQNLAKAAPKARWSHPEDFHLTLAFIGDVPHADLRDLCNEVAQVASGYSNFTLGLQGVGAFPTITKPRVLWAGVNGDLNPLVELRNQVVRALERIGYRPEDDRFHPHVTLGRLKPGRGTPPLDLSATEAHLRTWSAGPWSVDAVITYASHPVPDGPSYTALGTARLARSGS